MKYFLFGIALSIIGIIVAIFLFGIEKAYIITGSVGVIFICISLVMSGSMVSGDRLRSNFATESVEARKERNRATLILLLIGLPNILTSFLFYSLFP